MLLRKLYFISAVNFRLLSRIATDISLELIFLARQEIRKNSAK